MYRMCNICHAKRGMACICTQRFGCPGAPAPSNATQVTMVTALEPEMQNLREA